MLLSPGMQLLRRVVTRLGTHTAAVPVSGLAVSENATTSAMCQSMRSLLDAATARGATGSSHAVQLDGLTASSNNGCCSSSSNMGLSAASSLRSRGSGSTHALSAPSISQQHQLACYGKGFHSFAAPRHTSSATLPSFLLQQRQPWQPAQRQLLQPSSLQPHHPAQLQPTRGILLVPRRVKHRKAHKNLGFNETVCPNTRQLVYGLYGIRAMEHGRVPARTLEAVRRTLRRSVKKTTMIWFRVAPHIPVTKKPAEVRMGKGKGAVDHYAAPIRPGQILFELDRLPRQAALDAVTAISPKMPIKVGFVEWR